MARVPYSIVDRPVVPEDLLKFLEKRGKTINTYEDFNQAIREWKQSKETSR